MTVSNSRLRFVNDYSPTGDSIDVTIVIPMRNEETNVAAVCSELQDVIDAEPQRYEVIIVNDGSNDGTSQRTGEALRKPIRASPSWSLLAASASRRRSPQDSGWRAGRVVVAMDGDRQNDPRDIPALVAKLEEPPGYDVVSGWRKERQDKWFSRRLPSIWANALIRRRTWCPEIHDFGCTLKAYRREVLKDIRLYGEMHRFLPAICKWRGARLAEVVVNHRPRVSGKTKYGISRTIRVLLDLMTVKFLGDYVVQPALLVRQAGAADARNGIRGGRLRDRPEAGISHRARRARDAQQQRVHHLRDDGVSDDVRPADDGFDVGASDPHLSREPGPATIQDPPHLASADCG